MYKCSLERMSDKIRTFAKYGDAGHGGITRYSLSAEADMAREEFKKRMEAIGAKVECDDVACMYESLIFPNWRIDLDEEAGTKSYNMYTPCIGFNCRHGYVCLSIGLSWL